MALMAFQAGVGDYTEILKIVLNRTDGIKEQINSALNGNNQTTTIPFRAGSDAMKNKNQILDLIPGDYEITWEAYMGAYPIATTTKKYNLKKYSVIGFMRDYLTITERTPTTTNLAIALKNLPPGFWLGDGERYGGVVSPYLDGVFKSLYSRIDEWHTWDYVKEGWHGVVTEIRSYNFSKNIDRTLILPEVKVYIQCPPVPFSTLHSDTLTIDLTNNICEVNRGYPPAEETIQIKEYYLSHPYALDFLKDWQKQQFNNSLTYPLTITYDGKNYVVNDFQQELLIREFIGQVPEGVLEINTYLKTLTDFQLVVWSDYWKKTFEANNIYYTAVVKEYFKKYYQQQGHQITINSLTVS